MLIKAKANITDTLCSAAYKGDATAIKLLIAGAKTVRDPWDSGDRYRTQPILLLTQFAKFSFGSKSPLSFAAEGGKVETIDFLIDCGDSVNNTDNHGETPLFFAAKNGHVNAIKLLMSREANANIINNDLKWPHEIAAQYGHNEASRLLFIPPEVKNVNALLLIAAKSDDADEVNRLIINCNADVNTLIDKEHRRPLHIAAQAGSIRVINQLLLLNEEVDLNMTDKYERTPLYYAAKNGCFKVIEVLLEKGS